MSTRQLSAIAGVNDATIVRIEQGQFAAPSPEKLARLTEALGLKLADVFARAEYVAPSELPSFAPYLRSKYRDLPTGAVDELERFLQRLAKRHGIALEGPAPGEDEQPPQKQATKKKGGSHA